MNNPKNPLTETFNINRAASIIPKKVIGTQEAIKFPINFPQAIDELLYVLPLVPKFHEYMKNIHRDGLSINYKIS